MKLYNSSKRNNNCDARDCIREFYDKYICLVRNFSLVSFSSGLMVNSDCVMLLLLRDMVFGKV